MSYILIYLCVSFLWRYAWYTFFVCHAYRCAYRSPTVRTILPIHITQLVRKVRFLRTLRPVRKVRILRTVRYYARTPNTHSTHSYAQYARYAPKAITPNTHITHHYARYATYARYANIHFNRLAFYSTLLYIPYTSVHSRTLPYIPVHPVHYRTPQRDARYPALTATCLVQTNPEQRTWLYSTSCFVLAQRPV